MAGKVRRFLQRLSEWKRLLIIILTPILLCPLPIIVGTKEARTGYAILIMGTYWCTEVTDLAVTALLPLFLFPVLKVMSAADTSLPYFKDTNVLVIGGLIMAVAIERWNVHKRIALKVLLLIGAQPRRLMLGFMLVTAFISMWITNTATTAMMTPIMEAVLKELDKDYVDEAVVQDEEDVTQEDNGNKNQDGVSENLKILNMSAEERQEIKNNHAAESEMIEFTELSDTPSRSSSTKDLLSSKDDKSKPVEDTNEKRKRHERMSKAMMLSICYAANIGGTGTLTGTGPQLVLAGQLTDVFKTGPGMSFLNWFIYACPEMLLFLIIAWLYLQAMFFGIGWKHLCFCFRGKKRNRNKGDQIYALMKEQYKELGPISFAEIAVLLHFLFLVLCWMLRDPKFIDGWGSLFLATNGKSYVSDATAGILVSFSLFLFPSVRPELLGGPRATKPHEPLLKWKPTQKKFPWNIVLLLGSGFALAKACEKSGLSVWVGCQLVAMKTVPDYAIALIISILITFLTEFTSNTATATILLPILASLAQSIKIHPYYLMIPATVCASFAFMLPVATPPNAIVFATGRLTIPDMMKAGFGMNIIGIIVVTISINTIGLGYFGLKTFPDWAGHGGTTDKCGGASTTALPTIIATTIANFTTNSTKLMI